MSFILWLQHAHMQQTLQQKLMRQTLVDSTPMHLEKASEQGYIANSKKHNINQLELHSLRLWQRLWPGPGMYVQPLEADGGTGPRLCGNDTLLAISKCGVGTWYGGDDNLFANFWLLRSLAAARGCVPEMMNQRIVSPNATRKTDFTQASMFEKQ